MMKNGGPAASVPVSVYDPAQENGVRALLAQVHKRGGGVLSERTVEAIAETVSLYHRWRMEKGLEDGPEAVKGWFDSMSRELATATLQNRYFLFKRYLQERFRGDREGWLMVVELFDGIRRKQSRPAQAITEEQYLSVLELKNFVRKIEKPGTSRGYRLGLIVRALFWTGARVSELIGIRVSDCKRARGVVKITLHGKGRKDRAVEIPAFLFEQIRFRFKGRVFLFEENGKPLSRFAVTRRIERAGKEHIRGMKVTAHTLRHSRAMNLKERGLSPDRTAHYLGHKSPTTTFTYYYHGKPGTEEIGTEEDLLD